MAACSGGKSPSPSIPSSLPVVISDPMAYLAQSRGTTGDASIPLHDYDNMIYRRFDFGHYQSSDSFLTGPTSAITTWGYAPFGPFVEANGDGGERYELRTDGSVRITHTKHLGIETTPIDWTVLSASTVDCSQGWTEYNILERGCRATVTYPKIGPVDSIISEHRSPIEPLMERIFLARGWGRVAWQAFKGNGQVDDPSRCPDFGWNGYPNMNLVDCRYSVNVEPATSVLNGTQLWRP